VIEISRLFARRLRSALRKSAPPGSPRGRPPVVIFEAGRGGLRARFRWPGLVVECHRPGPCDADTLTLPGSALDDLAGGKESAVVLGRAGQKVEARWDDGGPQERAYPAADVPTEPPPLPTRLARAGDGFLAALAEASRSAGRDGGRFALQRALLRGGRGGELVATDGKQLLVQGGFSLPWDGDRLVPATALFAGPELADQGPASVGATDTHVCVKAGPWTVWLEVDARARFPDVKAVTGEPSVWPNSPPFPAP
jgi:hypothetical protein